MSKINILTVDVYTRINAGEVIERPYSVVKELVENSIDAGATEIEIYIEKGGKDLVKVVDNGCGIEPEDMPTAFVLHATSKIEKFEDIEHVHTLGFRGEALSVISSVSKVEMISSIDGVETYSILCEADWPTPIKPAVGPKGTTISVRNLFFNTPVRYKFLKQDKKEETDVTTYVMRFILSNPEISFRYYIDGRLTLQSYGEGLAESISKVYGANYLPNCFKISAIRNDIKVSGFIGNQNFFKANKTYQTTFLNGRYVTNQLIASAINNAYSPYTMKRQYPFYVLFIEMPDEMIDINVHPNKQDVRFANNQLVYGTIYKIISGILDGSATAAEYVTENEDGKKPSAIYSKEFTSNENIQDSDFSNVVGIEQCKTYVDPVPIKSIEARARAAVLADKVRRGVVNLEELANAPEPDFRPYDDPEHFLPLIDYFRCYEERDPVMLEFEPPPIPPTKKELRQRRLNEYYGMYAQYKYRGMLFNTYLIYEIMNFFYLVDQHAAHERIIYDKLVAEMKNKQVARQSVFIPYVLVVTPEEKQFINDKAQDLYDMGFCIEPFGLNSFRIMTIPTSLPDLDVEEFFKEFLSKIGTMDKIVMSDILKNKIAQTACKHAVKGGDELTDEERRAIFDEVRKDFGMKCPHGRPVCIKIFKKELEKLFKRRR